MNYVLKHLLGLSLVLAMMVCAVYGIWWGNAVTLNVSMFYVWAIFFAGLYAAMVIGYANDNGVDMEFDKRIYKHGWRVWVGAGKDVLFAGIFAAGGHFVTATVAMVSAFVVGPMTNYVAGENVKMFQQVE